MQALIAKLDKKGNTLAENPETLIQGDAALVEMTVTKYVCIEASSDYAPLSRIILHDGNPSTGDDHSCDLIIGVVKEVTKRPGAYEDSFAF